MNWSQNQTKQEIIGIYTEPQEKNLVYNRIILEFNI